MPFVLISTALLALIAGIIVLIFPAALRIIVGLYLILIGILGLINNFS